MYVLTSHVGTLQSYKSLLIIKLKEDIVIHF